MQDFCHTLKAEFDIGAQFYFVGSGTKNLILQNASEPIDLDYNLDSKNLKKKSEFIKKKTENGLW